jgi:hypothetical protein
MNIWQVDFYRRPLQDETGKPLWELVVCNPERTFVVHTFCSQAEANAIWLTEQLQHIAGESVALPEIIQAFRPQTVSLLTTACQTLGITLEPTRHTPALKQLLQERAIQYQQLPQYTRQAYNPLALEQPPPAPLPEQLWGEQWRFAAIAAADLLPTFSHKPIPIVHIPTTLLPINQSLPSTVAIPGVVIDGGRQSMQLARWLQQTNPVTLTYIPGQPDGLILEAGLVDRWILATFTDPDVAAAAQTFTTRLTVSQGLHFLLIQPDQSGMTYSGFWLLQSLSA